MKDSEGNFRTDVVLSDRDTHVPFSDKLRFVFLQLPCFKKEESECENDFERWIYVLKHCRGCLSRLVSLCSRSWNR